ncbi:MAG: pilus assembly protein [Anaerolineales bacterium]|jgi:hypothetical protein
MEETYNGINRNKEKAQGMVEFALTLPILLMLFFGIIEFGRLLFVYSATTTAAREAARYGSAAGDDGSSIPYYRNCTGIEDAALRIGGIAGLQRSDIEIYYDIDEDGLQDPSTIDSLPPCGNSTQIDLGDRIVVRVKVRYQPIVPLVNLSSFDISSVSIRTILLDLDMEDQDV